jgi:hypothetical protein
MAPNPPRSIGDPASIPTCGVRSGARLASGIGSGCGNPLDRIGDMGGVPRGAGGSRKGESADRAAQSFSARRV